MFVAPTTKSARDLTSRLLANKRAHDENPKGRGANNGGQQPRLPMSNIRRVRALLGSRSEDNFATTQFTEDERNQSNLHRLFYGNQGPIVYKWKHYLSIYDKHLAPFRNKPVRLLEIGVFKGGSMRLWRQYFGPEAIRNCPAQC